MRILTSEPSIMNKDRQSSLLLYDSSGDKLWNARCTTAGDLRVNNADLSLTDDGAQVIVPYGYAVVHGDLAGHTALNKFGHNSSVGATEEPIWEQSSAFAWPSAATPVALVSGDTADAAASPGARTVQIYGLNGSWAETNETLTLNGTTATTSVNSYLRVNRMIVRSAGATGSNASKLTCYRTGGTATQAVITTGVAQTLMAMWTVPANKTFYLTRLYAATDTAKATDIFLRVRPENEVFQVKNRFEINAGTTDFNYHFPLVYSEKTDIMVTADAAGGGGDVSAGFDGWYE